MNVIDADVDAMQAEFRENARKYWVSVGDGWLHAVRLVYSVHSHLYSKDSVTFCGRRANAWVTDTRIQRCRDCCEISGVPTGIGAPIIAKESRPYLLV